MGTHRTVAAPSQTTTNALSGAQAARQSCGAHRLLFVLKTGLRWDLLPRELGCGSGMSCWRRLRDWQAAGCLEQLHEVLLARLRAADQIDWSRVIVDSSSIRAVGSGQTGPNPTDRARPGSKHHLITEAQGIPLAVILTGANRNNVTQLQALVEAIPPIRGKRGKPLSKPRVVQGDRGYDHDKYRRPLHAAGIPTEIARRSQPHGSGLGKTRWVVERTISWLCNFRRLRIRFEQLAFIHDGFSQNRLLHHMLATHEKFILLTSLSEATQPRQMNPLSRVRYLRQHKFAARGPQRWYANSFLTLMVRRGLCMLCGLRNRPTWLLKKLPDSVSA